LSQVHASGDEVSHFNVCVQGTEKGKGC